MTTFNLTTTFTPPSGCLTDIYRYHANQLVGPMTASCYPQGWTNTSTAFYSPGICPSGYTTACIRANTANTVTETIATCCPTSFQCAATNNPLGCNTHIDGGKSQLITVMNSDFSSISTIHTELIGGYINAHGVQIRFQATDLIRVSTTTSTAITPSSTGATTPFLSATTPSPSFTPKNLPALHSGLSAGAKSGIGVGAALAVCIGLVLFWFGWRRTKRRRALSAPAGELEGTRIGEPPEAGGVKYAPMESKYHVVSEMQGNSIPEMQGNGLFEVPGSDPRREVEGHQVAHGNELEGWGR